MLFSCTSILCLMRTHRGSRSSQCVLPSISDSRLVTVSLTELGARLVSPSGPAGPSVSAGTSHSQHSTWVLGVKSQVGMCEQKVLLHTGPSPYVSQPHLFELLSIQKDLPLSLPKSSLTGKAVGFLQLLKKPLSGVFSETLIP